MKVDSTKCAQETATLKVLPGRWSNCAASNAPCLLTCSHSDSATNAGNVPGQPVNTNALWCVPTTVVAAAGDAIANTSAPGDTTLAGYGCTAVTACNPAAAVVAAARVCPTTGAMTLAVTAAAAASLAALM